VRLFQRRRQRQVAERRHHDVYYANWLEARVAFTRRLRNKRQLTRELDRARKAELRRLTNAGDGL
jgi:hypothetical protein